MAIILQQRPGTPAHLAGDDLVGKHVFHTRAERTDQFRGKQYTSPEVKSWRSICIRAKALAVRGRKIKLEPTESIPNVPTQFVVNQSELVVFIDHIRVMEVDGDLTNCNIWRNQ